MTTTLDGGIDATTHAATLDGNLTAEPGDRFRLESEMVQFLGYKVPRNPRLLDRKLVRLLRGVGGTTAASHANGIELIGLRDAYAIGTSATLPDPFTSGVENPGLAPDLAGDTGTAIAPPTITFAGSGVTVAVTQTGGAGTEATVEVTVDA
jgi:hypothetical protein